jgi:DNA-binding transcriptional regulator GbsR (MarR family)
LLTNLQYQLKILKSFNGKPLSAKDIKEKTGLDWTTKKLTIVLQKMEEIQIVKKGRTNQYVLKSNLIEQSTLFK